MSGSIAMTAMAALHTGSGLVTAAVPDRCLESVAGFHPALMTLAAADDGNGCFASDAVAHLAKQFDGPDVIGCGPGMTTADGSIKIVERLLQTTSVPRVFDADALNILALLQSRDGPCWSRPESADASPMGQVVLTPHPGEFSRLSGVSPKDRDAQRQAAVEIASRTGFVIVLKGGPTVVIGPDEKGHCEQWVCDTGNPGMATGGSGDVLTGMIASLMGQGLEPLPAAKLGVWVHGLAGDLAARNYGMAGMTAKEILESIPEAMGHAFPDSP